MADIATTKLFENDRVIVWEMLLQPGENTGVHTHEHDYVIHVIEGSTLNATDAKGVSAGDFELETGSTAWVSVKGDEVIMGDIRAPATHDATNVGSNRYREILVELK